MVPADNILKTHSTRTGGVGVLGHKFVGLFVSVDTCFGTFDREDEGVGDDEGVRRDLALEKSHDFNRSAGTSVHRHFEKREGRDFDILEVVRFSEPWFGVDESSGVMGLVKAPKERRWWRYGERRTFELQRQDRREHLL